jgi:hypothetical protein
VKIRASRLAALASAGLAGAVMLIGAVGADGRTEVFACKAPINGNECEFFIGRFAKLNGAEVVGQEGAPDGKGWASLVGSGRKRLCSTLVLLAVDQPTSVRLHRGGAGENGPAVLSLPAPGSGREGIGKGCRSGLSPRTLSAIFNHPARYYIEVRTGEFPEGAIRGQLLSG